MGGPVGARRIRDRIDAADVRALRGGDTQHGRNPPGARRRKGILSLSAPLETAIRLSVCSGGASAEGVMNSKPKVVVVMPAYNAGKTLRMTYAELPRDLVDLVILVDDGSSDETIHVARELGLELFVHTRNYGYGANQKTCYREALRAGADIVVMVHPDYQYDPTLL